MNTPEILFEDNHLLVMNKPAGMATMGADSGPTLHSTATEYLRRRYDKPGRAYLGIVSRLDAMTSGVIVMAKTSKAASRLAPQFASRPNIAGPQKKIAGPKIAGPSVAGRNGGWSKDSAEKIYLAVLEGCWKPLDHFGELTDFVRKDDGARRMRVVAEQTPEAQLARLQYLRFDATSTSTVVAIRLLSGRKHQIRVQFSELGFPVWADRKYGGRERLTAGIGLHSLRLRVTHPTLRERMRWHAGLPEAWKPFSKLVPMHGASFAELEAILDSRFNSAQ